MNKLTFTEARIRKLPIPEKGKRVDYYDTKIPKLVCRITSTGNKSYSVVYRVGAKVHRITLGNTAKLTVKQAQDKASIQLASLAKGEDPTIHKLKYLTLEEALEDYIKNRHPKDGKELKERTVDGYRYALNKHFNDWSNKQVSQITPDMVKKRYASLTRIGVATANGAMRVLRLTLNHTKSIGAVDNVVTDILVAKNSWNSDNRRITNINLNDLPVWHGYIKSMENKKVSSFFLLLIYTGLRRSEALGLKWSDVTEKTLTARYTKNHTDFKLQLSDRVKSILADLRIVTGESEWLFPQKADISKAMTVPKKHIARIIKETSIPFTCHDLRRTYAMCCEASGLQYTIIRTLLNHKKPKGDMTSSYIESDEETLIKSVNAVGDFIYYRATSEIKDNVVNIKRA